MGRPFRSWIFMGFLGRKVTLIRLRQCHPYVIYWLARYSYVYFRSKRVDRSACGRAWGVPGSRRPDVGRGEYTHRACLLLPCVIFHCPSSTSRWITVSCTFWFMLKISTPGSSRSSFQSLIILIIYICTENMWWLWLCSTVLYCTLINYVYHPTLEHLSLPASNLKPK